jgi:hypothetical protein
MAAVFDGGMGLLFASEFFFLFFLFADFFAAASEGRLNTGFG